jgi:peptidoglycan/LPS O-acetylase OafA/YrhL
MPTLQDQLVKHNNFGPGFNFARIFLAYGVVIWHTVAIAENAAEEAMAGIAGPFIFAILPMFFALSGFLVTGSALRLPLREYILNRAFRIFPALGVDILISAIILGPIFTVLPLSLYFSDPTFWSYFTNIFGLIQYTLPGVFQTSVYPNVVNGALWTVPFEIACYVLMSGLIIVGGIKSWKATLGLAVLISTAAITLYFSGAGQGEDIIDKFIRFAFFHKGSTLVVSFLAGSAIFLLKDRIPYSTYIAGGIFAAYLFLSYYFGAQVFDHPIYIAFTAFPLAYIVVWTGLTPIKIPSLYEKGDYSYGIYLYHFPIMQALQYLFGFEHWWSLAVACILPVTLFAMFSWHAIEKPVLKTRKKFSLVGARVANEEAA